MIVLSKFQFDLSFSTIVMLFSRVTAEWDLGEPPVGAVMLSHSAAKHKMAVRPRRTTGPTRHRRLQQLSASVLPSMPEMNEDVVANVSSMAKSQSEHLEYYSSSAGGASTTTTTVTSTTSASYARRDSESFRQPTLKTLDAV
jgi:hypothetical protein